MDSEEIQSRLMNLSKAKFRNVVGMVLEKVFGLPALNVDSKGDGGSDWWCFSAGGQKVGVAVQDTVQKQNWDQKALEDARLAFKSHRANRYFFCTNRPHEQIKVSVLENNITNETGMSATVLEARKLAELVLQGELEDQFLSAIGEAGTRKRPAIAEIALCVYTNISADRTNHRNEIYADTLLLVCRDKQPIERRLLVDGALEFLGSAPGQRQLVDKRVDFLLQQHKLVVIAGKKLALSKGTAKKMVQTERLYLSDWNALSGALTSQLTEYGDAWNDTQAERATTLLARLFIQEQLEGLKSAGASMLQGKWFDRSGNPLQQLRDLLQECGVPVPKLNEAIAKLIELARSREVIAKLTRTAVFAALEGQDPVQSARALGASGWDEVTIMLDTSVAIPYLCACLTQPIEGYFFALSYRAIEALRGLGAVARISPGYLEECAAHLLQAFRYEPLSDEADFEGALRESENAFVSFYYALRKESPRAPKSLQQFLNIFCSDAVQLLRRPESWSTLVRHAMPDLQAALGDYGVVVTQISRLSRNRRDALEKTHDWAILSDGHSKPPVLRRHDVDCLGHLEIRTTEEHESWMLLTWDKALMRTARDALERSWVVSPEVAMDFTQPCRQLSETQWCTLAHRLARVTNPGDLLTARIIDQLARAKYERLQDWEFKQAIRSFRDRALSRLPLAGEAKQQGWIDSETAKFMAEHSIQTHAKSVES